MKNKIIPLHLPDIGKEEIKSVMSVLKQGMIGGNGPISRHVEEEIAKMTKSKYAFFTNSCTSALELAVMACGIDYGDEVIVPSFSFVSVANAIVRQKAKPVFVEIDRDTLNIDVSSLKKAITSKTKAIIPVHYAGRPCYMDKIMDIAGSHNLAVIEDAAQAMGSFYKGRHLGTIGDMGCISFHATKNITCGEGGALLTNNKKLARKIEIMREKGTNRSLFLRGCIDKYSWVSVGSSYVQSDILAAILIEQLKKIPEIIRRRSLIAEYYNKNLIKYSDIISLPKEISGAQINWHIYAVMVKPKIRDWFIRELRREGIEATFHFVPLHASSFAKSLGYRKGDLPITEYISESLIRLPIYPRMKRLDVRYVVSTIEKIIKNLRG